MNKDAAIKELLKYIESVLYHDLFFSEFVQIIARSGYERQIFKDLSKSLRILSIMGKQAIQAKDFEQLSYCEDIYSMHLDSKNYNIRLLYGFLPNEQPVFLVAFFERANKRKTDYTSYIEPALSRFKQMKEDYENGF